MSPISAVCSKRKDLNKVFCNFLRFPDAQVFFVFTPVDPLQAQSGTNVTLLWDYTGSKPLISALWGILDEGNSIKTIIAQKHGSNDVQYLSSYRDRAFIQGRASLTLIDVTASDSGRYGCQLTFVGEPSPIINSTRLIVSGKHFYSLQNLHVMMVRFVLFSFLQMQLLWSYDVGLNVGNEQDCYIEEEIEVE